MEGMEMSIYNFMLTHTGISHLEKGMPNQDSAGCFCIKNNLGEIYLNVVADGVSACKYANEASMFLLDTTVNIFEKRCENTHNYELNTEEFKDVVNEIFDKYMHMIEEKSGQYLDYGSTLEIVAIQNETAYVFHAGDGLILAIQQDGTILFTDDEKHSGEYASQVFPFFVKSKWEFDQFKNVAALLVASDGVYSEIVPSSARRMKLKYDLGLLIPCIDSRTHRNIKSHKRFLDSYITGKLSDEIMGYKCSRLGNRGILVGMDDFSIRKHFSQNIPYRKNVRSRDDLSIVIWGNTELLPTFYDVSGGFPDYRGQWELERQMERERALNQQRQVATV